MQAINYKFHLVQGIPDVTFEGENQSLFGLLEGEDADPIAVALAAQPVGKPLLITLYPFGENNDPEEIVTYSASLFNPQPHVGQPVHLWRGDGEDFDGVVVHAHDGTVQVDYNDPLVGTPAVIRAVKLS